MDGWILRVSKNKQTEHEDVTNTVNVLWIVGLL